MLPRGSIVVYCVAATAGLFFASFSTLDFVAHLDRQTHELHCSFAPGLVGSAADAEGCQVTLMSPYSSMFRSMLWGGIPISLGAMAVFAFLLFRAIDLLGRPPEQRRAAANVLLVATLVPVLASIVMGTIAATELDAACKLCIGIYLSSAACLLAALLIRSGVRRGEIATGVDPHQPSMQPRPSAAGPVWLAAIAQLGAFVALPMVLYMAIVPDFSKYLGNCGALSQSADQYGVLVPLDQNATGVPAIEVFDPLCPSCKGFEKRLAASNLGERLHRMAVLFPLDAECNWMVPESVHPGACAVSEAVLCAHRSKIPPQQVIDWAFERQAEIMAAEKQQAGAARKLVQQHFTGLQQCLGSAEVKADLNKSLRWAVANQVPVLTPQLYVDGVKVCDADTDLGLDWALTELLERREAGTLPRPEVPAAAPKPEVPPTTKPASDERPARKPAPAAKPAAAPSEDAPEEPATPKKSAGDPALPSVGDEPAGDEPAADEPAKDEPEGGDTPAPKKLPTPEPSPAEPTPEEEPQ